MCTEHLYYFSFLFLYAFENRNSMHCIVLFCTIASFSVFALRFFVTKCRRPSIVGNLKHADFIIHCEALVTSKMANKKLIIGPTHW